MTIAEPDGTSRDARAAHLRTAERFLAQLGHSDVEPVRGLLSPSATYHVSGMHALSGTFSTPEDILGHLRDLPHTPKAQLRPRSGTTGCSATTTWPASVGLQMQANGQIYEGL